MPSEIKDLSIINSIKTDAVLCTDEIAFDLSDIQSATVIFSSPAVTKMCPYFIQFQVNDDGFWRPASEMDFGSFLVGVLSEMDDTGELQVEVALLSFDMTVSFRIRYVAIAQDGYGFASDNEATNPLRYSSDRNYQKRHMDVYIEATAPYPSSVNSAHYSHNLGYIPHVVSWCQFKNTSSSAWSGLSEITGRHFDGVTVSTLVTSTDIWHFIRNEPPGSLGESMDFRFLTRIYKDDA